MKPHYFLLFVLLLLGSRGTAWGQAPTLQWQKQLGVRNKYEANSSVIHTRHNRLLMAGYINLANGSQPTACWLLSNQGDSLRSVNYLQAAGTYATIYALAEAPNGDFLMLGQAYYATSPPTSGTTFLIRTDSLGNQRWVQYYNAGATIEVRSCLALADGGALLVVSTDAPVSTVDNPVRVPTVLRVDSLGNQLWQRTYGQPYSSFEHIAAMSDGSYALVGGWVQRLTNPVRFTVDPWLVRLNLAGDTLHTRVIPVPQANGRAYNLCLTPGGTLALVGSVGLPAQPSLPGQGLLLELDAQDRLARYHLVAAPRTFQSAGCAFYKVYALPTPGQYVVAGRRSDTNIKLEGYLARYEFQASGGATAAWQVPFIKFDAYQRPNAYLLQADHTLTVADWGNYRNYNGNSDVLVQRFAGLPPVYEADLCATPPVPNAAFVLPPAAPDSLNVLDLGTGGGAYAQLLHWRWELGDGTVVARTTPGWVRHRYATVPAFGTAVRVTVTNNLGCTATQALYPWGGRPTATQQAARALAAGTSLYPNPAGSGDGVTVRLPGLRPQPPVAAEVRDALGRVVARLTLPVRAGVAEGSVDVQSWPAGVYTVHLHPQEGPVTRKLVRQ